MSRDQLVADFKEIRRVATPWCLVKSSDYRLTIQTLAGLRYLTSESSSVYQWTCTAGATQIDGQTADLGNPDWSLSMVLGAALNLPGGSILFVVIPDDSSLPNHTWTNPFTIQAAAALRDEFKADRRTVVFISVDGFLPPLLVDDVPVLEDPLPDTTELAAIAKSICKDKGAELDEPTLKSAADACRGMSRFSAECAYARKISKKGEVRLQEIADLQRIGIEQATERALTFTKTSETFDDIGGLDQVKKFAQRLFSGNRAPKVVVRIEEIEKAMAGAADGADSSGTSKDQLGVLLTAMEDYGWTGFVAVGHPGSGKSLVSRAMAATYERPAIDFDLGACLGQYVGTSQQKIRKAIKTLHAFAGPDAFFVATSNDVSTLPPALLRRFRFGRIFFDLPTKEERGSIWAICLRRFMLNPTQDLPDDTDWTGADIRNVCDLADRLNCSLIEASEFIVPVAKADPAGIEALRNQANGRLLSASAPGPYCKPVKAKSRAVAL